MNKKLLQIICAIWIAVAVLTSQIGNARAEILVDINSVSPNIVSNTSSTELVITGSDFVNGAQVVLENFGLLQASFVSSTVLTAQLPAGLNPGSYTITVVNPDSSSASLSNAVQVVASTETEPPAPAATVTPAPEETRVPGVRPLVVIDSYDAGVESISPNQEFELNIKLSNIGDLPANNLIATFPPGDVVPRVSGGVLATTELDPGERKKFNQPLTASYELWGKVAATVVMQVSYTDPDGVPYSETFNMTIPVTTGKFVPTATPTPTSTPPPSPRPQLVIPSYTTDTSPLQPGSVFNLTVQISNQGDTGARQLSMILGGGGTTGNNPSGTPDVSGISGASGNFGTFAPVASSNVQFLGDLAAGADITAQANLIVNANTSPGAYPFTISFTYVDDAGRPFTDDQVITLLVYSLPMVDVNFYREPDPLFAGQQGMLPIQVVNLGRKPVILGTMKADGEGAQYSNNSVLVGALDIGGYYTMDAMVIPDQPGPLDILVSIDYTDDFNQLQVITKTLSVEVQEMFMPYPGPEDGGLDGSSAPPVETPPETLWQKVLRFVKGLFGLDSGQPTPVPGEMPPMEMPPESVPAQPVPSGKG
jgi:hypothetical protein